MLKLLILTTLLSSCSLLIDSIGGDFSSSPDKMKNNLSKDASALIEKSFEGININCLYDTHFHAVGNGSNGSKNWINPEMIKWIRFQQFLQYKVYLSASNITDPNKIEQQYNKRVLALLNSTPRLSKVFFLAFDKHYDENGNFIKELTNFYIDNDYVYKISRLYPDKIFPAISIHPARKDAISELEKWGKKGVRLVKWLPNAMGIDPANKKYIPFYKTLKKYNMFLLSHTGHEKAVHAEAYQKLGNPHRLKLPLDLGVNVIMAHAASLGNCKNEKGELEHCFDSFWKLFTNKKYEKNLYLDTSALLLYTRIGKPIDTVLNNPKYHDRIFYGSDYPLPAINLLYRTSQLEAKGHLTSKEAELLKEIYQYNPHLFEFVMKRTIKHPKTKKKLTAKAFEACQIFEGK